MEREDKRIDLNYKVVKIYNYGMYEDFDEEDDYISNVKYFRY